MKEGSREREGKRSLWEGRARQTQTRAVLCLAFVCSPAPSRKAPAVRGSDDRWAARGRSERAKDRRKRRRRAEITPALQKQPPPSRSLSLALISLSRWPHRLPWPSALVHTCGKVTPARPQPEGASSRMFRATDAHALAPLACRRRSASSTCTSLWPARRCPASWLARQCLPPSTMTAATRTVSRYAPATRRPCTRWRRLSCRVPQSQLQALAAPTDLTRPLHLAAVGRHRPACL